MPDLRGSSWGPLPLPDFLAAQLSAHGFRVGDASKVAAQLRSVPGQAATASLFVDLGSCKFLEGDLDGAVAAWRHAITSEFDAAAARALLNMGLMYEHLHLMDRATGVLGAVSERAVGPYDVDAALALARCHRRQGDAETATEAVARIAASMMTNRPQSPVLGEILLALGDLAQESDRPDRAERSWRVAAAGPESPARQVAVSRLLELSIEQGHDDEFVELLANRDAFDAVAGPVMGRAASLLRLGHEDRALEVLSALDDDVLTSSERFELTGLLMELGQVNEAIDQLEILLGSPIPEIWQRSAFLLGELYNDYDMPEVAAEMFDRVGEHVDRYWAPKAALMRGDIFATEGDQAAAEALWADAATCEVGAIRLLAQDRLANGLVVDAPDVDGEEVAVSTDAEVIDAEIVLDNSPSTDAPEVDLDGESPATPAGAGVGAELHVQPVVTEPAVADPVATEPAVAESVATEPVATAEAAVAESVVAEPVATEPAVAESVVAEPVATEPALAEPVAESGLPGADEVAAASPEVIVLADLEAAAAAERPPAEPSIIELADTPPASPVHGDGTVLVQPAPVVVSLDELEGELPSSAPLTPLSASPPEAVAEVAASAAPVAPSASPAPPVAQSPVAPAPAMPAPAAVADEASVFSRLSDLDQPVTLADDTGTYVDEGIGSPVPGQNPYASLAPDGYVPPPPPATNPYAELSPTFDDEFTPAPDVEPGDWQAMMDDGGKPEERKKKRRFRRS